MDPEEALENWRAACAVIRAKGVEPDDAEWYSTEVITVKVRKDRVRDARADKHAAREALIEWLHSGGFEPEWKNKRERSYFIA